MMKGDHPTNHPLRAAIFVMPPYLSSSAPASAEAGASLSLRPSWERRGLPASRPRIAHTALVVSDHRPRRLPLRWRRRQIVADQLPVGHPAPDNGPQHVEKPLAVVQSARVVA